MPKVYLSPSVQQFNIGYGNFGSEEYRMNQIADAVERHLCAKKDQITIYRNSPNMTLAEVVADSNAKRPDIHVAIHSNASDKHDARGAMGFAYKKGTKGDALAQDVYNEVNKISPAKGHGVIYSTQLYELRRTVAPATLIEVAFHDNPEDAEFMMNNIDNIGGAIAKGILKNLNIRYRNNSSRDFDSVNDFDRVNDFYNFDEIDDFNDLLEKGPIKNEKPMNPKNHKPGNDKNIKYFKNPGKGPKCIKLMILFENEANIKSALILSNKFAAPMINLRHARKYMDKVENFIIIGKDSIGIRDSYRIDEGDSVKNLEKVLNFVNEKSHIIDWFTKNKKNKLFDNSNM